MTKEQKMLTLEEVVQAEISRKFEESAEVVELRTQLNEGLITSVEFANKILDEWAQYFPQNYPYPKTCSDPKRHEAFADRGIEDQCPSCFPKPGEFDHD